MDVPFDDQITTEEAFDAALSRLLAAAAKNGVEPQGAWAYRNLDGSPDLEVMIVELQDSVAED